MREAREKGWGMAAAVLVAAVILLQPFAHAPSRGSGGEKSDLPFLGADLPGMQPWAVSLEMRDSLSGFLFDRDGFPVGKVLYSGDLPHASHGYGGPLPLFVVLDMQERVQGVCLCSNHETPIYLRRMERSRLLEAWNGKTVQEASAVEPDAVSGATVTSQAVIANVGYVLDAYARREKEPVPGWRQWQGLRLFLSCIVVLFSLYCFFRPEKMRSGKTVLYAASIMVLGFWNGQMLSLDRFYGWLAYGIPPSAWLVFGVFLLAVLLPLLSGRPYYCAFLCPYGAAQELAGRLLKRKCLLPAKAAACLRFLPKILLAACAVAALTGLAADFSGVEVFAAFRFRSASAWVLALSGFFLLLSVFVKRPWCRYACPTGYLLSLFQAGRECRAAKSVAASLEKAAGRVRAFFSGKQKEEGEKREDGKAEGRNG